MRTALRCSVILGLVGLAGAAAAQAPPEAPARPGLAAPSLATLAAELERLRAEVMENRRTLSQVPGAVGALGELEARLGALQAEVARLAGVRQAETDRLRELDRVHAALVELRERLGEIAMRQAETPVVLPQPAGFGYDPAGFFFRTADSRFELRLSGYLQPGWEGGRRDTDAAHEYATYEQWRNLSTFSLRRATLLVFGHAFMPAIRYSVELDFARMSNPDFLVWHDQTLSRGLTGLRSPLEDCFVEVMPWAFLGARVGQFRVPFGRTYLTTPDLLAFVDRAVADPAFTFDRDVGLMLQGAVLRDRLAYQGAVLNGAGANRLHTGADLLYVARLVASPLGPVTAGEGDREPTPGPRFAVGASYAGRRARVDAVPGAAAGLVPGAAGAPSQGDGPALDHVIVNQVGVDAVAKWRGASLQGEYVWRRQDNDTGAVPANYSLKTRFRGGYVQAGYFVLKRRLEVAGRFAYTDVPGALGDTYGQRLQPRAVYEGTLGVGYYQFGHNAKVLVDGSYLREKEIAALGIDPATQLAYDRDGLRLRVMVQVRF